MSELDLYFDAAVQLIQEAGKVLVEATKSKLKFEKKASRVDLVTEVDKGIEKLLIDGLKKKFPNHKFIGEESAEEGKCELTNAPTWLIDPIDGTMNFIHSFPYCCISVGLLIDKKLELGIVFNPRADRLFTAKRGQGAYCNNEKIGVSAVDDLSEALLITEVGAFRDLISADILTKNLDAYFHNAHSVRALGSAALNLCSVAAGEADVYVEYGIHCWDMAAGCLIAKEAGAYITSTDGGPFDLMSRKIICASSKPVAEKTSTITTVLDNLSLDSKEPALNIL